jgi:hypothetical protein
VPSAVHAGEVDDLHSSDGEASRPQAGMIFGESVST